MRRHIIESWILLLYFDCLLRLGDSDRIYRAVRKSTIRPTAKEKCATQLCHAIDLACVFYFKRVLCLHRSAATTVLLRRYGWNAQMVIGVQAFPFQSHAWVEIGDRVVNDKPYITEMFQALERC